MQTRRIGALAVTTLLVAAACSSSATTAPAASAAAGGNGQIVNIGVELPMSGGEAPNGVPTLNGVKLAVADINAAGGIDGYKFGVNSQDDAVNGVNNPQQGAKNITTLVNDTSVVAVVGPFNSAVAKAEIPISNAAGLLQCSPANTNPGLTKEWGGISPTTFGPRTPTRSPTCASHRPTTTRAWPARRSPTRTSARAAPTSWTTPRPTGPASRASSSRTSTDGRHRRQA